MTLARPVDRSPPGDDAPILIVDDDASIRELFGLILRRAGWQVIQAGDGEECLRLLKSRPVALVLLDLQLPGTSGLEVLRDLRGRPDSFTTPVIVVTGSGDEDTLVEALAAGAGDFLAKPIRSEELIARVRAHLRIGSAWTSYLEQGLRVRSGIVSALGRLAASGSAAETTAAVIAEVGARTGVYLVRMLEVTEGRRLRPVATFTHGEGLVIGGPLLPANRCHQLLSKTRDGPWVETIGQGAVGERANLFWRSRVTVAAGAPVYAGTRLVGVLILGGNRAADVSHVGQSQLLAAAIDYATVLAAYAGSRNADRRDLAAGQARLRAILDAGAFHPVFQPIVELETLAVVGYEALTRFSDGTAPDVRFADATAHELGAEFELVTMEAAIHASARLPAGAFLSLNASPAVIVAQRRRLQEILRECGRPVVLELTEHAAVDDYPTLVRSMDKLKGVDVAIDDAGAGYSSLRHVLELRPRFVKLDISLVRGIDGDDIRRSLVAGLVYFAARTGYDLIAEGIETQAEADALSELGVQLAQGYLFHRPARA